MNMMEVDPMLIIKCRLCLSETGQYQIAPNVQMQIKYCFDIDVQPFDGLPQLVCKKCESILSQYTGIKQYFQEKQKHLMSNTRSNINIDNTVQQQHKSASFTQTENGNKEKPLRTIRDKRKNTTVPTKQSALKSVTFKTNRSKDSKIKWQNTYTKYFVCRFCDKHFKDIKSINNHILKECRLYMKYFNINKSFCLVELNKIGSKYNINGSVVVYNENKIIQSNKASYYILYTKKPNQQNDLSDSDANFVIDNKKRKRKCLNTRSSNKSIAIEHDTANSFDDKTVTKVWKQGRGDVFQAKHERDPWLGSVNEFAAKNEENLGRSSSKPNGKKKELCAEKVFQESSIISHDKIISSIIARCSNKYLNRFNLSEGSSTSHWQKSQSKEEKSHEHKIDNIERKVIYDDEFIITSILKSIEQRNLEVVWLPKVEKKVTIKTRSKDNQDSYKNDFSFKNITSLLNNRKGTDDFVLDFDRISKLDSCVNEKSKEQQCTKLNEHCSNNVVKKEQEDFALVLEGISELEACINKNIQEEPPIKINTPCQENATEKEEIGPMGNNTKKHKMPIIEKISNNDLILDKFLTSINALESKKNDNVAYLNNVMNMDKNSTKLLNSNPVANPKKLPKKNFNEPNTNVKIYSDEPKNVSEIIEQNGKDESFDMLHMPCIASRLRPVANILHEQTDVGCNNNKIYTTEMNNYNRISQSTLPKIQCKPISELMSDEALHLQNNSFVPNETTNWSISNENQSHNIMMQPNVSNMLYIESDQFTNENSVQPDHVYYPQGQNIEALIFNPIENQSGSPELVQNHDTFNMHFVRLANTRAKATFRYFRNNT